MFPSIASFHGTIETQNICVDFRSRLESVMDTVAKTVQCVCTVLWITTSVWDLWKDTRLWTWGGWDRANVCCLNCARFHKDSQDCQSQFEIFLKQNGMLCQELFSQRQKMTVISVVCFHHSIITVYMKINLKLTGKEKHDSALSRKGLEFILNSKFSWCKPVTMILCTFKHKSRAGEKAQWLIALVTLPDHPDYQNPQGSSQLSGTDLGILHPLLSSTGTAHKWCTDKHENKIPTYIK